MAITAVAAIASAGAVAEGLVAVETLATIAAVTSVVGMVTDSKELKSLGAGMGLGAMGAGLLGLAPAEAATEAAAAAGNAGASAGSAGAAGAGAGAGADAAGAAAANAADTAAATGGVTGSVAGGADALPLPDLANGVPGMTDAASASGGIVNGAAAPASSASSSLAADAGGITAPAGAVAPTGIGAPLGPVSPTAPVAPWSPAAGSAIDSATEGAIQQGIANTAPIQNSSSFFGDTLGKVGTWVNNNKTLAAGVLNMAGGLAQGAANGYAADRQYNMQQQIYNTQVANANAQPRINMTVNPNAAVFSNPPTNYGGIIAGARGGH